MALRAPGDPQSPSSLTSERTTTCTGSSSIGGSASACSRAPSPCSCPATGRTGSTSSPLLGSTPTATTNTGTTPSPVRAGTSASCRRRSRRSSGSPSGRSPFTAPSTPAGTTSTAGMSPTWRAPASIMRISWAPRCSTSSRLRGRSSLATVTGRTPASTRLRRFTGWTAPTATGRARAASPRTWAALRRWRPSRGRRRRTAPPSIRRSACWPPPTTWSFRPTGGAFSASARPAGHGRSRRTTTVASTCLTTSPLGR
mmetsp:Transcript_84991/g.189909  ORF Transcript_84991/g.189909 Transcript_84991/m.189909 type:complete len:256 (+) Transcript_84991:583-1350(+)